MEITLKVLAPLPEGSSFVEDVRPPGANTHGPGHRVVFSDNLLLEKVDPRSPPIPCSYWGRASRRKTSQKSGVRARTQGSP